MTDYHLYTRLLLPKGHGFPLFLPSPPDDLPEPVKREGTRIGDVGIVCTDGSFDPIFNILCPEGHLANRFGVPPGFEKLVLRPEDICERVLCHPPGSVISNTIVKEEQADNNTAGGVVDRSMKQMGLLKLPDGASSWDLLPLKVFRDYALKHAANWYTFVNDDLQRLVGNSSLYLATGVTKCTSWGIGAFDDCSGWEWEDVISMLKSGPHRRPGEESWRDNQTLFIRGFKVAIRLSGAPPSIGSDEDPEADEESLSECAPNVYHPSDIINQNILNSAPNATVAVTHDDEWTSVLKETDTEVPDDKELIKRISDKAKVKTESHRPRSFRMDPTDYRAFYPYTPNEVKHRKQTTSAQLKVLEGIFKRDTKPNAALRTELAAQLNMTARGVQVWFQNRCAKEKTKAAKGALNKGLDSPLPCSSKDVDEAEALPKQSTTPSPRSTATDPPSLRVLTRQPSRASIFSWWSDSNPSFRGPTISLHAAAKPLMKSMYHRQALDFIKNARLADTANNVAIQRLRLSHPNKSHFQNPKILDQGHHEYGDSDSPRASSSDPLDELRGSAQQNRMNNSIIWLHGPAGAGKSAISQMLVQALEKDRNETTRLGSSFFFYRKSYGPANFPHLPNLASALEDRFIQSDRLSTILGVAEGLRYLHSKGVVHGDLKTANILVDDNDHPLITDFGISSTLSRASMTTRPNCESSQDHPNIMRLLLEKDAELETVGGSSRSALQAAFTRNDIDGVVRLLLKDGADVNAVHGCALEAAGSFDHRPPDLDMSGIGVRVAMFVQSLLSLHSGICALWGGTVPAYELKPGEAHMAQIPAIVCLMLENTVDGSARKDLLCRLLSKGAQVHASAAGSHLNAFGKTQCCHCRDPPIQHTLLYLQVVSGYQGIVCASSADSVHAWDACSLDLSHSNA